MAGLIAIDPGATSGWACFVDGVLVSCGKHQASPFILGVFLGWRQVTSAVIEKPMVYPGENVDANDLITLTVRVGEWKSYIEYFYLHDGEAELVTPPTWKGSVPKEIHNRRTLETLTEEERSIMPKTKAGKYDHNMLDAVGLGLWKLGRSAR